MNKNKINISQVETYLNSIFDNVISNNTYFTNLPKKEAIPTEWQDMWLVEIPNGIEDMNAMGIGTVLVWLYARPLSSGRKNVAVMSKLESKLNEVLKNASDKGYILTRRDTYTSFDTNVDWHCNAVEIVVQIF